MDRVHEELEKTLHSQSLKKHSLAFSQGMAGGQNVRGMGRAGAGEAGRPYRPWQGFPSSP